MLVRLLAGFLLALMTLPALADGRVLYLDDRALLTRLEARGYDEGRRQTAP